MRTTTFFKQAALLLLSAAVLFITGCQQAGPTQSAQDGPAPVYSASNQFTGNGDRGGDLSGFPRAASKQFSLLSNGHGYEEGAVKFGDGHKSKIVVPSESLIPPDES